MNTLKLPKKFDLSDKLSILLNSIIDVLSVDSIYLSNKQIEKKCSYFFVTLFIDCDMDLLPNEILKLISKIENEFPHFKVLIFTQAIAEKNIERGSFYFLEHCCFGYKLYSKPEGDNILDYEDLALHNILKRAERYYMAEMKKINGYINSSKLLIKQKNYDLAGFNLHQAFLLSFKCIEHLYLGQSKTTLSLIGHIKNYEPFFPKIIPFKNVPKKDQNEWLLLLDHAFNMIHHDNPMEIDKDQCKIIFSEIHSFINKIEKLHNKHLKRCHLLLKEKNLEITQVPKIEPKSLSRNDQNLDTENEKELFNSRINDLISKRIHLLKPNSENTLYKSEFLISGLSDVLYDIAGIMKVCILALEYSDSYDNKLIPQPHINIKTALEHIMQLLPFDEMECLEEIVKGHLMNHETNELNNIKQGKYKA
ncbi:HEPN domain-containing protein [Formosa sp. A9]|uniref:HEPN domain-containing protein n=1 Tax=Formosa sp. A9 TaxID=3442641 RepID=UPI003EB79F69